jgi:hypothetical protein
VSGPNAEGPLPGQEALLPVSAYDDDGGPVLGEDAREIVWNRFYGEAPRWCADAAVDALEPYVAALLAQARDAGAAEERERIAAAIEHAKIPCPELYHDRLPKPTCPSCARNGGLHYARRIARDPS